MRSAIALLQSHPRMAGVHINIEPLVSGDPHFLILLEQLQEHLPAGMILSVAAYPPPTMWQPNANVHWDEEYYKEVSQRVDQLVVMMYDTAITWRKPYRQLMSGWTTNVLDWAQDSQVLLRVPAYDDAGASYYDPSVENMENALMGIHASLQDYTKLPEHFAGIAIYCEWELDEREWQFLRSNFLRTANMTTEPVH